MNINKYQTKIGRESMVTKNKLFNKQILAIAALVCLLFQNCSQQEFDDSEINEFASRAENSIVSTSVNTNTGNSNNSSGIWSNSYINGWFNEIHIRTIADVNGDGKGDIVGFGNNNVLVSLSNGNGFGTPTIWSNAFANGWNNAEHVRRVADVNGDGKADIVGFGDGDVFVALSTGSGFATATKWSGNYTNGWNNYSHVRRMADVNGDGKADIVGFGTSGVFVALSNGFGFGTPTNWTGAYANGWNNENNVRRVADVNGDGKADIIGFGTNKVYVSLSSGTGFGIPVIWNNGYTNGWNIYTNVRTVVDVNNDGKADIIGFGTDEVVVSLSNGTEFGDAVQWDSGFTNQWNNFDHVRIVSDVTGDGKGEIIGFGSNHVGVLVNTAF